MCVLLLRWALDGRTINQVVSQAINYLLSYSYQSIIKTHFRFYS